MSGITGRRTVGQRRAGGQVLTTGRSEDITGMRPPGGQADRMIEECRERYRYYAFRSLTIRKGQPSPHEVVASAEYERVIAGSSADDECSHGYLPGDGAVKSGKAASLGCRCHAAAGVRVEEGGVVLPLTRSGASRKKKGSTVGKGVGETRTGVRKGRSGGRAA